MASPTTSAAGKVDRLASNFTPNSTDSLPPDENGGEITTPSGSDVPFDSSPGGIIVATGDGQSAYRHPAASMTGPGVLIAAPTGTMVMTPLASPAAASATASSDSAAGHAISGGALFAAIFLPILLLSLVILGVIFCVRRRRRHTQETGELKTLSQGSADQILKPGAVARNMFRANAGYYTGVEASAAAANNFSQPKPWSTAAQDAPPPYPPPVATSSAPRIRSPSHSTTASPLSEVNMATYESHDRRSPFDHPDDDVVSEVSEAEGGRRLSRDMDAVSVVSGFTQSEDRVTHPRQVL
ncbi:MAG: hypothetical protein M1838_003336 [Thelocarpon superellum]|nr:MAG: hypothetical protein M1838_003336 [Thelocarpon superellum]